MKKDKIDKVTYLTVLPVELGFGDYEYMVKTPTDDTMYFNCKKKAQAFINFYKRYQEKSNEKVTN
jgi:hypothetical protein